jgi:hypothetical protein
VFGDIHGHCDDRGQLGEPKDETSRGKVFFCFFMILKFYLVFPDCADCADYALADGGPPLLMLRTM